MAFALCLVALSATSWAQTAIGQWRDHFAFTRASCLAIAHDRIYAAFDQCVGYYDMDLDAVGRLTKIDGLSDVEPRAIAYDSLTRTLVIAYDNANIDLVCGQRVHNISDLKRSALAQDKEIYAICCRGRRAYLSTSIGIVAIDLERREIEGYYRPGDEADPPAVYDLAFADRRIYAATAQGIYSIAQDDRFPNIGSRWQADTTSRIAGTAVRRLAANGATLMAVADSYDPKLQYICHSDGEGDFMLIDSCETRSLRCANGYTTVATPRDIRIYDSSHQLAQSIANFDWVGVNSYDALRMADGTLWTAHDWAGLLMRRPDGSLVACNPQGNFSDHVYSITAFDDKAFICPGGKSSTNSNSGIAGNLFTLKDNSWSELDRNESRDTLIDFLTAAVNPRNPRQIMAAAWGQGVVEIVDNTIVNVYNDHNSDGQIKAYDDGSFRHVRIGGVAFDKQGTLWATNSLAEKGLIARRSDGTWEGFDTRALFNGGEVYNILCDSVTGYKWITGHPNLIYAHDGSSRMAKIDPNSGSRVVSNRVNCLVQDRSGDLWLGTDKGIKVIYDGYNAFANGGTGETSPVSCVNIVISNDEFAEYLMAYEDVRCIAVDGANRKWVGTAASGIYLLSASGLEELAHFTTANSPLPSNQIVAIGVQPLSGEVLIGTPHGTVGYRSDATYATSTPASTTYAFPNPVRPDYDGPIAIKGLTNNALVHITDISGHVVFTTRALGGQAIWQARTNEGRRVASGVYYVFASDEEGSNRSVAKILVVK